MTPPRDPFNPDLPVPDYEDAPTWGPKLPEEDDAKEYVAIEDLDEETAAAVRDAAGERAGDAGDSAPGPSK